ncbi:hypothetical protein [Solidesulfovibrio sp.]|uniref:hypothetical protein n=1 Tax=Solidesulfovibrio sp. TaxID=2910990 RepID=UPI002B201DD6|nr:hypothetical protein [Solidesulfovibrio sp.]MEA4858817.1 hypothetical protein [Solidesulfovibrio sp.]
MRIVLHAGLKKTGSTAIQVALARDGARLSRLGVFVPEADMGLAPGSPARTSGNAYGLALLAEEAGVDPAGAAGRIRDHLGERLERARRAGCGTLLLSSETLCALSEAGWRALFAALADLGRPTRFVVFERDPYAWYFSVWLQAVKRDGCAAWLDAALAGNEEGFLRPLLVPTVLGRACAGSGGLFEALRLDYDACRRDAAGAFFAALGLPRPETAAAAPARFNRSLSPGEAFAFLTLNRASGGNMKLCQALCDKYVTGDADRERFFFFDPAVQAAVHAFLDRHGAGRPEAAYPETRNLTFEELAASQPAPAPAMGGMLADAVAHFRDFSGSVAALALHKARHYAASPARGLVPGDFDILCYLIANPDVLAADCDPYRHYVECGRHEGRTCRVFT